MGPKPNKQKSRKEQILMMRENHDQLRKSFNLWPYHPEHTQSHLVLEVSEVSLVSTWTGKRSSEETAQREAVWRQGGGRNVIKVQMESLVPDLSK
jgi:hypothetical protein